MSKRDIGDAERFLRALFPRLDEQNLVDVIGLKPGGGQYGRAPCDSIAQVVEIAEEDGDKSNLYFRLSTCKAPTKESLKGFGAKRNLSYAASLWADVDVDEVKPYKSKLAALTAIQSFEPAPSIVVDSGGGYHVYWLLTEPAFFGKWQGEHKGRMDVVEGCNRGIRDRLTSDNCWDASRILRIPGTFNLKKAGHKRPVSLVQFDDSIRYDLDELVPLLYEPYFKGQQQPRERPAAVNGDEPSIFSEAKASGEKALRHAIARGLSRRAQDLIGSGDASGFPKSDGTPGDRSRMSASVVMSLLRVNTPHDDILAIFKRFRVGERYRQSGGGWLAGVVQSAEAQLDPDYKPPRDTRPPPPTPLTPATWAWSHAMKMRRLIAVIHREGPLTKKTIRAETGWAPNTVDDYVRAGVGAGWLREGAVTKTGKKGRPPTAIHLTETAPKPTELAKSGLFWGLKNYAQSSLFTSAAAAITRKVSTTT